MSVRGESEPPRDWEALILSVLAGEIARNDPRVLEMPEVEKAKLERLQTMHDALAKQAAQDRLMQSEVEQLARGTVPAEVREFLLARAAQPRIAARRRPWVLWAAAAAAGLLVVLYLAFAPKPRAHRPNDNGGTLGPQEVEPLRPKGEVDADELGSFEWKSSATGFPRFEVHVFDGEGGVRGKEIAHSGELEATTWRADQSLPARIRWRVDVIDGTRITYGPEVEAWRRR
jgi:hypothetical protein